MLNQSSELRSLKFNQKGLTMTFGNFLKIAILATTLNAVSTTHAATLTAVLTLNVGVLPIASQNNEFLFTFQSNSDGTYKPLYYTNSGLFGNSPTSYTQGDSQLFSFQYFFTVNSTALLSQNTTFVNYIGAGSSSVTLLQGANLIATATPTTPVGDGFDYQFPTTPLQANTAYTLVLTGRAPSTTFSGQYGQAQIALDVSPVPEPASYMLFVAGLGILVSRRNIRRSSF